VFISYSHSDREFVRRLAADLRGRDFDIWLDEWEIRVGDDIRRGIEHGISTYDYFAVVLSPASVASNWVQSELSGAFSRQVKDRRIQILPILLADCEIPPLIAGQAKADFTGHYERGLAQLLASMTPLADGQGREGKADYLSTVIADTEYIDSPIIDMLSSDRIALRDIFVSLQAASVHPRSSADILIQEELERILRSSHPADLDRSPVPDRAILERIRDSWRGAPLQSPRLDVEQVLDRSPALVVLGHPGSGKSTLLRYIALVTAKQCLAHGPDASRVPFLVRLPELEARGGFERDCGGALSDVLFDRYGAAAVTYLRESVDRGKALLLLDGLDEVGDIAGRTKVVIAIQRYARKALGHSNRVVVTSRIVGYRTHRPLGRPFEHYAIADMDSAASRRLVASLLRELHRGFGRLLTDEELRQQLSVVGQSPGAEHLLARPLTATLVAAISAAGQSPPSTRVGLFSRVVTLMEEEWSALTARPAQFSGTVVSTALSGLAQWLLQNRTSGLLSGPEAHNVIASALTRHKVLSDSEATRTAGDLLGHIRSACGVLVEMSPGLIGFSQRPLLEFYAALDVVRGDADVAGTIGRWSQSPRYAEVVAMVVGLSDIHHPGRGEQLLNALIGDGQSETPVYRSLLAAMRSVPEIFNPSARLTSSIADAVASLIFDYQTFPYGDADDFRDGNEIFRATMFASFRKELHDAITVLSTSRRYPDITARIMIRYRSLVHGPDEDYQSLQSTLSLLDFLGATGRLDDPGLALVDALLDQASAEEKKAAVRCLYETARTGQNTAAIERLRAIAMDDSAQFEYKDYHGEAVTGLCRLDHQEPAFLDRIEMFLRERTTFESYAVAAGLPYLAYNKRIGRLYRCAVNSRNGAVTEDFVIEIGLSGRANQITALQDALMDAVEKGSRIGAERLVPTVCRVLGGLDWMSTRTRERLFRVVLDIRAQRWARMRAAYALRHHATDEMVERARLALREGDPVLRYAGLCFLRSCGVLPQDCVDSLVKIANSDADPEVQAVAFDLLAEHGYANPDLTQSIIQRGLLAEWNSSLRNDAIRIAGRGALPAAIAEELSSTVEEYAERISHGQYPEYSPYDITRFDEKAYNAALFLAHNGKWTDAVAAVLRMAAFFPSNTVRGRVYQDCGLGSQPSPELIALLLDALHEESEDLVGRPSLYTTLDQISPLTEAGLDVVLQHGMSTDDIDVLAFCCQLIRDSVRDAGQRPSPDLLRRCFELVAKTMCGPIFDWSMGEDLGGPLMRDRVYDALLALFDIGGETLAELNRHVLYPWRATG
jgi:energy-coupling factor transporter ATP-binding protein EcfA2